MEFVTNRKVLVAVGVLLLAMASPAETGFGMVKTRVMLPRIMPPQRVLLARTVAVEATARGPEITGGDIDVVRTQLADALGKWGLYEVVEKGARADATITVSLDDLRAEVRDEIKMESRYVKIGERQEWNAKKKKMESKDVMGYRNEPVPMRVGEGSIRASVETTTKAGRNTADASTSYSRRVKQEEATPELMSEGALRQVLVAEAAARAIAAVTFATVPVEALLAATDKLKPGNRLAQAGLFKQALEEWQRLRLKGKDESERLHNIGVAQEALAYEMPPHSEQHRQLLGSAKDNYRAALTIDPGEKYFVSPLERIEMSLEYATRASALMSELERFRTSSN